MDAGDNLHPRANRGIQAPSITVEARVGKWLPAFTLVGLPESTGRASRDRVCSAILNSGYQFPARRITVSLAPVDLPKEGGATTCQSRCQSSRRRNRSPACG